jgi:hypothetical protein
MCSYITEKAEIFGSAKGANGWFAVDTANVYYDHPYHAPLGHSLNIDFVSEADGAFQRVAIEISADSALQLIEKIKAALDEGAKNHTLENAPVKV